MKYNMLFLRLIICIVFACKSVSASPDQQEASRYKALTSFTSERLKYEFLKSDHLPGIKQMYSQLDLHTLMGKPGFTADMMVDIFKTSGENVERLGATGTFNIHEPVLLIYGISTLHANNNFAIGDVIGAATIQKLSSESIARKNKAFAELERQHGSLYIVGLSFRPDSQGTGFGKESCKAIIDHFFQATADIPSAIVSSSFKGNIPVVRLVEGCGFTKFLEEKNPEANDYFDVVHYVKLRN